MTDFWDGLPKPLTREDVIKVSVDLTDFEDNVAQLALLAEHLFCPDPMTARLSKSRRKKHKSIEMPGNAAGEKKARHDFALTRSSPERQRLSPIPSALLNHQRVHGLLPNSAQGIPRGSFSRPSLTRLIRSVS
jgi:hypothetical protein